MSVTAGLSTANVQYLRPCTTATDIDQPPITGIILLTHNN